MQPCLLRQNRYFKPDNDLVVINTEDDGGVPGKRAAKRLTTGGDYVSTFLNVKQADNFQEACGQFPAVFVQTKYEHLWKEVGKFPEVSVAS